METTRRLREVYHAVAESAWNRAETRAQAETEKLQAALDRVQEGLDKEGWSVRSEGEAQGPSTMGNENQDEDAPLPTWKSCHRRVITSLPNTAEVVMVRSATKRVASEEAGATEEVSRTDSRPRIGLTGS